MSDETAEQSAEVEPEAVAASGAGGAPKVKRRSSKRKDVFAEGPIPVGAKGPSVERLQRRLSRAVTGVYDRSTANAVRLFQRSHGLRETGSVDAATRRELGV